MPVIQESENRVTSRAKSEKEEADWKAYSYLDTSRKTVSGDLGRILVCKDETANRNTSHWEEAR